MKLQGIAAGFALASTLLTTGCIPQNGQTQGLFTPPPANAAAAGTQVASANAPCTPNATADLISTGRSLLEIGTSIMQTKANMNSANNGYNSYTMQDVENAQKINKGNEILNNVETMTGGPQAPCS
jgi:hypothetical protein